MSNADERPERALTTNSTQSNSARMSTALRYAAATGAEDSALLRRLRDRTFRTPEGKAVIAIDSDRGRKIVPIHSRTCRLWIGFKLEEESGKQPSQAELRSTCDRLEVYASDAPVADVHVRLALAGGRIYIDLADDRGRVVEIGPDGWRVIDTAPVHFIRTPSMQPLSIPVEGGSIDDLRSFLNVDDDDFVLIVGCLLNGFRFLSVVAEALARLGGVYRISGKDAASILHGFVVGGCIFGKMRVRAPERCGKIFRLRLRSGNPRSNRGLP
jgi:hypothetical protein